MTPNPTTSAAPVAVPAAADPLGLDPQPLLEASRPRPLVPRGRPVAVLAILSMVLWSVSDPGPAVIAARSMAAVALIGAYVASWTVGRRLALRAAAEQQAVDALDELVQLRRWPEAADLARRVLSRPMLMTERRLVALRSLATVLARYHRFAEAREVHDYLLSPDADLDDASLAHSVKVARAMTMLREDHLVDADKAMNDLRREVIQARDAVRRAHGVDAASTVRSAGLVLLDLYRDVKTGHPDEAAAAYAAALPHLPAALGVRVADAHALAAAAFDRLGRADEAAKAYADATALVPAVELHRRYPETAGLASRYPATAWPQ